MAAASGTALHSEGEPLATSSKATGWLDRYWPELLIVLVALLLRLVFLELKPPHFDEGVNGFFVDQMTKQGPYHYDHTNFHGPLHFYPLFLMQTLFGRHIWALRLPTVLFSTLCVVVALGYRRYLTTTTCRLAAIGIALSPAMTFYGRYAIHESFMLLSLMVTVWGIVGLWRRGGALDLWATVLGIAGMILTKETYVVHLAALALAFPTVWLLEQLSSSREEPSAPQRWTEDHLKVALAVGFGSIIFFYSGCFMSWGDLPGLWRTFEVWANTGTDTKGGHVKEWHYWFKLLARYEWPALIGLALSPLLAWPQTSRTLRYMAIAGGGALAAYSIIHYKTPWCLITIIWPFFFVFGAAVEQFARRLPEWAGAPVAAIFVATLGHSAYWSQQLNFVRYADDREPYVYVQTLTDIRKVMDPLNAMVADEKSNYHLQGIVFLEELGDGHPLPWLLGDFPKVETLYKESPARGSMDADFMIIQDPYVSDVEDRLRHKYFREAIELRGSSGLSCNLYFDARKFARVFPGRQPEFEPAPPRPAAPPETEP